MPERWKPILTGDLRTEVMASIEAITSVLLQSEFDQHSQPGLANGSAGVSLFFSSLSAANPTDDGLSEKAMDLLESAAGTLASQTSSPSLYAGFTGIAWTLEHLQGRLFTPGEEDPNTEIDEALGRHLDQRPWPGEYDLISGLVGHGLYALDRTRLPMGVALLESVIERLSETAVVTPEGVSWFTGPQRLVSWQRENYPNGYYNLGLAHGVPGVIALLGQACAVGVAVEKARPLLDGAVSWMLSKKRDPAGNEAHFATLLNDLGEADSKLSRIAWCYGDLGIAVALLWAARSVQHSAWEDEALTIARSAARRPVERSGVVDAGLCHGAAGAGHLFNRLYQATGEEVFLEAARGWFERCLALRKPGEGIAGYLTWSGLNGGHWRTDPALLEGAAGIGLAFLAAVTSIEPAWDRMLMVSIPPKSGEISCTD